MHDPVKKDTARESEKTRAEGLFWAYIAGYASQPRET